MSSPRIFWTLGTSDLRTLVAQEFGSADCADRFRAAAKLEKWVLVAVAVSDDDSRVYWSPEQPFGPAHLPAASGF